jgi:ankyrin repeat protein
LLEHGARGDVLLSPGGQTARTALHEAANRGHDAMVQLLLEAGANPLVRDAKWAGTAGGWAEAGGHAELAARLGNREKELARGKRSARE